MNITYKEITALRDATWLLRAALEGESVIESGKMGDGYDLSIEDPFVPGSFLSLADTELEAVERVLHKLELARVSPQQSST